jgi:hypothetical protein
VLVNSHSFLCNLPSRSIQRIRWRPADSNSAKEIIGFLLEKFETIAVLDIRPHLGDSTSSYLAAACEALAALNERGVRRSEFQSLLISHTSFRYESFDVPKDIKALVKLDIGLKSLKATDETSGNPYQIQRDEKRILGFPHDIVLCQVCERQYAHNSGNRTLGVIYRSEINTCMSCSEYCSICDSAATRAEHIDEDYLLEGRCYHGDGEILSFCEEHSDTNLCEVCNMAQCNDHLLTCALALEEGCRCCIDCCDVCPSCNKWYCEEHMDSYCHAFHECKGGD